MSSTSPGLLLWHGNRRFRPPHVLRHDAEKKYDADLAHHQEGLLDVLNHAGFNLLWRDNDGGCKGACDRVPHTDMTQWKLDQFCKDKSCIDDVNLYRLDNVLDGIKQDTVLVYSSDGQPRSGLLQPLSGQLSQVHPQPAIPMKFRIAIISR